MTILGSVALFCIMYFLSSLVALTLATSKALAVSPVVKLSYSSYQGTALGNNITQWLGIRFAAPPLGDLRFSAPQDPLVVNGTVQMANAVRRHQRAC